MEKSEIYHEAMRTQAKGFNCSETVLLMCGRYYLPDIGMSYVSFATGFGGGVGRSRQEVCGALSGSVIALSLLAGRQDADTPVDPIHEKVSGFRELFKERFGHTICETLREGYEGDAAKEMCHNMTAATVELLFEYFQKLGIHRRM
jgi:C_GCAxxG_C_C family probable redox protein